MWEEKFFNNKQKLSQNIKLLRLKKGIAQEKLGLESGVDRTLISKIEREIANPSLEVLVKISTYLDVPLEDLFKKI
jgi:transcriptional regulator with XRE-family HTH domain